MRKMMVEVGNFDEREILDHNAMLRKEERHHAKQASLDQLEDAGMQFADDGCADADDGSPNREEQARIVRGLIKYLPAKQQEAFKLAFLEGKSERQIAEVLRISNVAVHKRIANAKKNLRFLVLDKTHHCKSHGK
jgi:RNA polymerase sigma factor (sigma-70 family)